MNEKSLTISEEGGEERQGNNEQREEEHIILNPKATLTNWEPTATPGSETPNAGQDGGEKQAAGASRGNE